MLKIKGQGVDNKHNRSPKDIDVYAGEQLKKRRKELGLSQKTLAQSLGVTFQQIQKYEKGLNRIGASRLYDLCSALKIKPSYFFKNINYEDSQDFVDKDGLSIADGQEYSAEIVNMVKLYESIKDPKKRKAILDIIESLSE